MAGHVAKLLHGVPHVVTAHSLEPLRPWKAEQLGGGYALSSLGRADRDDEAADAVVAVSAGMRDDVLRCYPDVDPDRVHVVHNGIDTQEYAARPRDQTCSSGTASTRTGRSVVFVGRITRQKGLPYLLRAALSLDPRRPAGAVRRLARHRRDHGRGDPARRRAAPRRDGVVWIDQHVAQAGRDPAAHPRHRVRLPVGLRADGHRQPRGDGVRAPVVATATGGIPEVVADGETGLLVPIEQVADGTGTPLDPTRFEADLADALTEVLADPGAGRRDGPGRPRAGPSSTSPGRWSPRARSTSTARCADVRQCRAAVASGAGALGAAGGLERPPGRGLEVAQHAAAYGDLVRADRARRRTPRRPPATVRSRCASATSTCAGPGDDGGSTCVAGRRPSWPSTASSAGRSRPTSSRTSSSVAARIVACSSRSASRTVVDGGGTGPIACTRHSLRPVGTRPRSAPDPSTAWPASTASRLNSGGPVSPDTSPARGSTSRSRGRRARAVARARTRGRPAPARPAARTPGAHARRAPRHGRRPRPARPLRDARRSPTPPRRTADGRLGHGVQPRW